MSAQTLQAPKPRFTRRVSSDAATREELHGRQGATVVVPPKHLMASSSSHEVAAAMEHARQEISRSSTSTPETPPETIVTDKFAYAFDIDGVLIRGGKVIPEAVEAMKMLNGENEYGIKV